MSLNFVIPEMQLNGAETSPLQFFRRGFLLNGTAGSGPSWQDIVLSGNGSLSLTNAKANGLNYLKLFGGTEQSGTPTPTSPIDIVSNNGTLKMVDDELPAGYKRVLGYECDNNVLWQITGFKLRGSDTVRISFSVTAACNVFGCYQGASADDNYDLYVSTTSGSKYCRYGNGTYLSYWSSGNLGKRFDVVFTPNGSQGMPQDSTWSPETFESANDLIIGSTSLTGTSAKLKGNLYGNFEVDNRLKIIPCERLSDNSLGYYDTYSKTFFEPTGTPTSLGYDGSHYVLTVDGTVETVEVDTTGDTATAEMLLKVGDYQDVQNVTNGNITRNVGIKVLDGTEDWFEGTSGTGYRKISLQMTNVGVTGSNSAGLCTHCKCEYANTVGNFYFSSSGTLQMVVDSTETLSGFKTWLANQYANGTPVIVVYTLATATTETVTGQHLGIQAGTNVVEITQASIDNLELEVSYKGKEGE